MPSTLDDMPSPEAEAAAGEPTARDPHPWRGSIALTVVVVVVGMVWSVWIDPIHHHTHFWLAPFDVWAPIPSAQYVANGALPFLYEGSASYVAPPLFAIVLSPIAFLGQTFDLSWSTLSTPLQHPTLWLIYGPFGLALTYTLFRSVRTLGAVQDPRGLFRLQVAALLLVAVPVALNWGHYEDVLALAAVLAYVTRRIRGRDEPAALWLSLAIGLKQWALLALPIAIATSRTGRRGRTAALAMALPVALTALPLAVDWRHAAPALLDARTYPWLGRPAPWVIHPHAALIGTPARLGAVALAVLIAWFVRDRTDTRTLLAALGLAFLGRLLFEPTLYAYYVAPGLMLLVLHEREARGRIVRATTLGIAALSLFLLHLPNVLWWTVECATWVALAWPAACDLIRDRDAVDLPAPPRREPDAALAASATS